jgi:FKBP-type peptidyl-prolyl cis-trans isomerase FklB
MRSIRVLFPGWTRVVGLAAAGSICLVAVFARAARETPAGSDRQVVAATDAHVGTVLTTAEQTLAYALGVSLARQLQQQSIDVPMLVRGLEDARGGGKVLLTDAEARAAITKFQTESTRKGIAELTQRATQNASAGKAFSAANRASEGVVTLASGLQYKVLEAGEGKKPTIDDRVTCHYRGTLIDGTEFDSSRRRNQPATFPLNKAIKGWAEALQLMPVGSKWQLVVPPHLAYGERGAGLQVGPNATLVFELELLSIAEKTTARSF